MFGMFSEKKIDARYGLCLQAWPANESVNLIAGNFYFKLQTADIRVCLLGYSGLSTLYFYKCSL